MSGGSTSSYVRSTPTTPRPPDVVIIQPRKSPGVFGTMAGTAAGVAAGTVIGDKITGRNDPPQAPAASAESLGPCQYEQDQLLNCTLNQNELQACEPWKNALLDCKRKYNLR